MKKLRIHLVVVALAMFVAPLISQAANLFEVDWSTATGKSTSALTDGGLLQEYGFPADNLLTAVDLPSALPDNWPSRGLEIRFAGQDSSLVGIANGWPAPPEGGSIYYRMFLYNALPSGSGVFNEHGQQTNIGNLSHYWSLFSPIGSGGDMSFGSTAGGFGNYFAKNIPANKPLRLEWALHRTTGANARFDIRIYDESVSLTVPQWTKANFLSNWGEGPGSLADFGVVNFNSVNDAFRSYLFGVSGSSGGHACCVYVTGFAVSHDGWIGPYTGGGTVTPPPTSPTPTPTPTDTTPPTATITVPSASQILPSGTTSTNLSVTTNENAVCRWSATEQTYANMAGTFATTGGTSHSTTMYGFSDGNSYTRYVRCADTVGNTMTSSRTVSFSVAAPAPAPEPTPTPTPTPTPSNGATVSVNSSYPGYTTSPVDDGVVNATGGVSTTWASGESSVTPNWIQLDFPSATTLNNATVYWAFNNGAYTTSQSLQVQSWNGSSWQTLGTLTRTSDVASSKLTFSPVTTSRIRFYQPANQGHPSYPIVLWVTELDYSNSNTTPTEPTSETEPTPEPTPSSTTIDRVKTISRLSVRTSPSSRSRRIAVMPAGSTGSVVSGPVTQRGASWLEVDYDNGPTGWSAEQYLEYLPPLVIAVESPDTTVVAEDTTTPVDNDSVIKKFTTLLKQQAESAVALVVEAWKAILSAF